MSDEKRMSAFFEALADNVGALSDEEMLAEAREEGRSGVAIFSTKPANSSPEPPRGAPS